MNVRMGFHRLALNGYLGFTLLTAAVGCRHGLDVKPPEVSVQASDQFAAGASIAIMVRDNRATTANIGNHANSEGTPKPYTVRNLRDTLAQRVAGIARQYGFGLQPSSSTVLVVDIAGFEVLTNEPTQTALYTRQERIQVAGTVTLFGARGEKIYSAPFTEQSNGPIPSAEVIFARFDDSMVKWFEQLATLARQQPELIAALHAPSSNATSAPDATAEVAKESAHFGDSPATELTPVDLELGNNAACDNDNTVESKWIEPRVRTVEKRYALVIGNGAYSFAPLGNPVTDARLLCRTLLALGFQVKRLYNSDRATMKRAIENFGNKLTRGSVGLFYYAGHGAQLDGKNFVIPVDAKIASERDIDIEGVDVDRVLVQMDRNKEGINVVILDACRNNPFPRASRAATRGLALISQAPNGTLIAYSTSPGSIAEDGGGKNSPYTEALAKQMTVPGAQLEETFKAVRRQVEHRTQGRQRPWELSSLTGNFQFASSNVQSPAKATAVAAAPAPSPKVPARSLTPQTTPPAAESKATQPSRGTADSKSTDDEIE